MTQPTWDDSYTAEEPPPWDIGRPQPAFVRLAESGLLTGQVLDVGCGTGEQSLLAASHGARATGVDLSPTAIAQARAKAAQRGLDVRFRGVTDALDLGQLDPNFDVIIDGGVFHVYSAEDRPRYVPRRAADRRPAGTLYLMCFSDRQPGDWGPRRVREDELRASFSDHWAVQSITADTFEIRPMGGTTRAQAWLAVFTRR